MKKCFLFILWLLVLVSFVQAQQSEVSFSVSGGFYDSTFHVALSCADENCFIRYTTNGNKPTAFSKVYSEPLLLDENLYSYSNIYTIRTCPDSIWYQPDAVQHCIVIRAAAFDAKNNRVSEVVTNSYFIKSLGCDTHGLPAVSLCADSLDLFDYERGIMVSGVCFDSMAANRSGNYFMRGREWERTCNVEFYELDNKGVNQRAGLRMHGNGSRGEVQKGMKLYARMEYGKESFQHPFFCDRDAGRYKRLVMKPFGYKIHPLAVQDYVCSRMAGGLDFESVSSRMVVVFLNGEYWGMYNLKEKPDEYFVAMHSTNSEDSINIIENWSGDAICGTNESFLNMMRWFAKSDLSSDENYAQACSLIDVDSFIDYYCLEMFVGNYDWPNNNMRCWRAGEGKWRWLFFDGDDCLDGTGDIVSSALAAEGKLTDSNLLFNKLLMNQNFRDKFYGRFGRLMTHQFDYKMTSTYLEENIATIQGELESHVERFGKPVSVSCFDLQMWYADHFLKYRVLNMASLLYRFYYYNGWKYNCSEIASQKSFKLNLKHRNPTFFVAHGFAIQRLALFCNLPRLYAAEEARGHQVERDL